MPPDSGSHSWKYDAPGLDDRGLVLWPHRPENEYQALMEAAPGQEPDETADEAREAYWELANSVAVALEHDDLTEFERTLIRLHYWRGISLRDCEAVFRWMEEAGQLPAGTYAVSKSPLQRQLQVALKKLGRILSEQGKAQTPPHDTDTKDMGGGR